MQLNEYTSELTVIGGGVAGLATATFLARDGRRVRLFEQDSPIEFIDLEPFARQIIGTELAWPQSSCGRKSGLGSLRIG